MTLSPTCAGCSRRAADIPGYADPALLREYYGEHPPLCSPGESLAEAFAREDGTYNPASNHFMCDGCYVAAGCPSSPGGWKAP